MATAQNEDTEPRPDAEPLSPVPAPPAMLPRTRAGFTWVTVCVAAVALIVLIVFIAQNTNSVQVSFFSLHGRFPLSVALLAAVAAGCVFTLAVGTIRILQLRRAVRRQSKHAATAAAAAETRAAAAQHAAEQPVPSEQPELSPGVVPVQTSEPDASTGSLAGSPDPSDPGSTGFASTAR